MQTVDSLHQLRKEGRGGHEGESAAASEDREQAAAGVSDRADKQNESVSTAHMHRTIHSVHHITAAWQAWGASKAPRAAAASSLAGAIGKGNSGVTLLGKRAGAAGTLSRDSRGLGDAPNSHGTASESTSNGQVSSEKHLPRRTIQPAKNVTTQCSML